MEKFTGKIIDAHLHLDPRFKSASEAVEQLLKEMASSHVAHAIVLHLLWQPWSVEEVATALAPHKSLTGFVNVDPTQPNAVDHLKRGYDMGFRGLKLHPRMQKYRPDSSECIQLVQYAGKLNIPALVDCFPDGNWLMDGLNLMQYAQLALGAPQTKVIVAHAAGHHCIDLLMLAKRIPNMHMDLSYSLLYYDSPVTEALFYCLKSIRYERVNFGTDYPDRPLKTSVDMSLALFDKFSVTGEAREKILWKNALDVLKDSGITSL